MELEATAPYAADAADADASTPGGQIGRYHVVALLGRGGMGVVLRARDPELDRDVALKVLRPDLPDVGLASEAQAMARLAHPNVVAVYEVGRAGARRFIAMELVAGDTLRGWMATRRPWREVVAMFVAAGRGLAAAHAAGLVHGDFKPDNVLVGRDGRPRVGDFGLVSRPSGGELALGTGGTPAYMAPEQWRGEELDPRADQFAFAVALWEALWGARPFVGESRAALGEQVLAGAVRSPTARAGVPRRIEAALRRALASDRAARWPDLPALLAVLERALGRRRLVGMIALAAAAVAVGAVVATWCAPSAPAACAVPDGREVWGPVRRARVAAALTASDPRLGAARLIAVGAVFDRGIADWRAASAATCQAYRIDHVDSDTLHDQRVQCLAGWLDELDRTVALVEHAADGAAVDRAVVAASQLTPVARCSDVFALARAPVPAPAHRAEAAAIASAVVAARVARRGGGPDGRAVAGALVERARAVAHPPTLALALEELAQARIAADDMAEARATLEELAEVAARAPDDRRTAVAWVETIRVLRALKRADEARQIIPVAHAAVARAGDDRELRVQLAMHEATMIGATGEAAKALALLDEARGWLDPDGDAELTLGLQMTTAITLANGKRFAEAAAAFERGIGLAIASLGADHPQLVGAYMNLAEARRRGGQIEASAAALREAARIAEARGEQTKALARIWARLAGTELATDHADAALALYDRAIGLVARVAPDDVALANDVATDRGLALRALGRFPEAVAAYDLIIARAAQAGLAGPTQFQPIYNRGCAKKDAGDLAGALADFEQALAAIEARPPELHVHLVSSLVGRGETLVRLGRPAEAIAPLTRALAMKVPPLYARTQPVGRYFLARALAESKRDVAQALIEARAARAAIAASGDDEGWLPAVDAFIAAGGRQPGGVAPLPARR